MMVENLDRWLCQTGQELNQRWKQGWPRERRRLPSLWAWTNRTAPARYFRWILNKRADFDEECSRCVQHGLSLSANLIANLQPFCNAGRTVGWTAETEQPEPLPAGWDGPFSGEHLPVAG